MNLNQLPWKKAFFLLLCFINVLFISFYLYKPSPSTDPVKEIVSGKTTSVEKTEFMSRLTSSVVLLRLQSKLTSIGGKDGHGDKTTNGSNMTVKGAPRPYVNPVINSSSLSFIGLHSMTKVRRIVITFLLLTMIVEHQLLIDQL